MRGKVVGKLEQEIEKTQEAIQDMNKRAGKCYDCTVSILVMCINTMIVAVLSDTYQKYSATFLYESL